MKTFYPSTQKDRFPDREEDDRPELPAAEEEPAGEAMSTVPEERLPAFPYRRIIE